MLVRLKIKDNRYLEALQILQLILRKKAALFYKNHPSIADTVQSMGKCLMKVGQYLDAALCFQMAMEVKFPIYGVEHYKMAELLKCAGINFKKLQLLGGAGSYLDAALAAKIKALPEENKEVGLIKWELGDVIFLVGSKK